MNARIEFNSEGFKEILTGDGVKSLVSSTAQGIASRAGAGFEATTICGGYGGGRWVGFVSSTDAESAKAESEYKVLSGAVSR